MSATRWLRSLFARPATKTDSRRQQVRRLRPRLEVLEDRTLMHGSMTAPEYISWAGQITSAPSSVRAGETVSVTVDIKHGGGGQVSMSYADPSSVKVNGQAVSAAVGVASPKYDFYVYGVDHTNPDPEPVAGAVVNVPAGVSTIEFTILATAPDDHLHETGAKGDFDWNLVGPWISLGGFYIGHWSSHVPFSVTDKVLDLRVHVDLPHSPNAHAEDELTYGIEVGGEQSLLAEQIVVHSTIPAGTTLVEGSISDPGELIDANTIRWVLHGGAQSEQFKVRVAAPEDLAGLSELTNRTTVVATFDGGTTSERRVIVATPLVKATQVMGKVFDVSIDFPAKTFVELGTAGTMVKVILKKPDGTIVDRSTVSQDGSFELDAEEPGEYIVELKAFAALYDTANEQVVPNGQRVIHRKEITIEADQTEPEELDDLYLPVSVVSGLAESMHKLNHLEMPVLNQFFTLPFWMDTTRVQQVLNDALKDLETVPFQLHRQDSDPNEYFNGLIRTLAFMKALEIRWDEDVKLADQFGKSAALLITTSIIRDIMKSPFGQKVAKIIGQPGAGVPEWALRQLKIFTLGEALGGNTTSGGALEGILQRLFDWLQIPRGTPERDRITQIAYWFTRTAFDKFTGQLADDLIFEVIFDGLRIALNAAYMNVRMLSNQNNLNFVTQLADRKFYSGGTNEALAELEKIHVRAADRTTLILNIAKDAQFTINLLRMGDGLWFAADKVPAEKKLLASVRNAFSKFVIDPARKLTSNPQLKGIMANLGDVKGAFKKIPAFQILLTSNYALTIGLPLIEGVFIRTNTLDEMANAVMIGPIGEQPNPWWAPDWLQNALRGVMDPDVRPPL